MDLNGYCNVIVTLINWQSSHYGERSCRQGPNERFTSPKYGLCGKANLLGGFVMMGEDASSEEEGNYRPIFKD